MDIQSRVRRLFDRYATAGQLSIDDFAPLALAIAQMMQQGDSSPSASGQQQLVDEVVDIMQRCPFRLLLRSACFDDTVRLAASPRVAPSSSLTSSGTSFATRRTMQRRASLPGARHDGGCH